ncbi:hypothetical protein [Streptomyces sp. NPDC048473]|uniref:hypothetical protein n=1 Tax=unclassified Streptomyces TaxID=2593676 RepID=UPI0037109D45
MTPVSLVTPDASACGLVEDTRKAKRLLAEDGELRSAHLSEFAYRTPGEGAALLRAALVTAAAHGHPALFTAVDASDADALRTHLGVPHTVSAPATVYGSGLEPARPWSINTSEI